MVEGAGVSYAVDEVRDEAGALGDVLQRVADDGGRVVSVTWQPEREPAGGIAKPAGYTVVSEYRAPQE